RRSVSLKPPLALLTLVTSLKMRLAHQLARITLLVGNSCPIFLTDYPTYRANGWDIGSGPTAADCQLRGERLKGSGRRGAEHGAAAVGVTRARYVSSRKLWDGFWEQP